MTQEGLLKQKEEYQKMKDGELIKEIATHIPRERNIHLAQAILTARYSKRMSRLTIIITVLTAIIALLTFLLAIDALIQLNII